MLEPQQLMCRLHLTEEPTAKGMRLTISLDYVNTELTPDDQVLEEIRLLAKTRYQWEAEMLAAGRTIAPAA